MGTVSVPAGVAVPPSHLSALRSLKASENGDWVLFSGSPETATYTLHLDIGDAVVHHTIQLDTGSLFDLNNQDEIDSQGKRFGDDGRVVARIPMHLLYSDETGNIGRALDEGDRKKLRHILNDSDYRKFRSFRGRL